MLPAYYFVFTKITIFFSAVIIIIKDKFNNLSKHLTFFVLLKTLYKSTYYIYIYILFYLSINTYKYLLYRFIIMELRYMLLCIILREQTLIYKCVIYFVLKSVVFVPLIIYQ